MFDECFNQVIQKRQMEIKIRYWDNKTDLVTKSYLSSCFNWKAAGFNLLEGIIDISTWCQGHI